MQIQRIGLIETDTDNNENYISYLSAVIESIDELCSLEISKNNTSIHFRIAPSTTEYCQPLLQEILNFNNKLGIRVELSKSIKNNSTLNFYINLHSK